MEEDLRSLLLAQLLEELGRVGACLHAFDQITDLLPVERKSFRRRVHGLVFYHDLGRPGG